MYEDIVSLINVTCSDCFNLNCLKDALLVTVSKDRPSNLLLNSICK